MSGPRKRVPSIGQSRSSFSPKGKEKNFAHPCKYVSYKCASHMLVPVKSRSTVMFRVERKYPEQCWESDMDAFEKTLAFWKEVW